MALTILFIVFFTQAYAANEDPFCGQWTPQFQLVQQETVGQYHQDRLALLLKGSEQEILTAYYRLAHWGNLSIQGDRPEEIYQDLPLKNVLASHLSLTDSVWAKYACLFLSQVEDDGYLEYFRPDLERILFDPLAPAELKSCAALCLSNYFYFTNAAAERSRIDSVFKQLIEQTPSADELTLAGLWRAKRKIEQSTLLQPDLYRDDEYYWQQAMSQKSVGLAQREYLALKLMSKAHLSPHRMIPWDLEEEVKNLSVEDRFKILNALGEKDVLGAPFKKELQAWGLKLVEEFLFSDAMKTEEEVYDVLSIVEKIAKDQEWPFLKKIYFALPPSPAAEAVRVRLSMLADSSLVEEVLSEFPQAKSVDLFFAFPQSLITPEVLKKAQDKLRESYAQARGVEKSEMAYELAKLEDPIVHQDLIHGLKNEKHDSKIVSNYLKGLMEVGIQSWKRPETLYTKKRPDAKTVAEVRLNLLQYLSAPHRMPDFTVAQSKEFLGRIKHYFSFTPAEVATAESLFLKKDLAAAINPHVEKTLGERPEPLVETQTKAERQEQQQSEQIVQTETCVPTPELVVGPAQSSIPDEIDTLLLEVNDRISLFLLAGHRVRKKYRQQEASFFRQAIGVVLALDPLPMTAEGERAQKRYEMMKRSLGQIQRRIGQYKNELRLRGMDSKQEIWREAQEMLSLYAMDFARLTKGLNQEHHEARALANDLGKFLTEKFPR